MAANAISYLRNVGRSLGYATIDIAKEYNPGIFAFAEGAKDLGEQLYDTIDDFKGSFSSSNDEKSFVGTVKSTVKDTFKNLVEDARSGNWYNKARIDKAETSAMMGMLGLDDSDDVFSFDFDEDSFDFDDDEESSSSKSEADQITESQKANTATVVTAMDAVGSKVSTAIGTATVQSAEYVVKANRESSKALYAMHQRGYQSMITGMAAINSTLNNIGLLAEPLTSHMQNSATFYTKSTEYQDKVLGYLEQISKFVAPSKPTSRSSRASITDFMDDGVLNLASVFDYITTRAKTAKQEMDDMLSLFGGGSGLKDMIIASPIKMIMDPMLKSLIPQLAKDAMESFNDAFQNFFTGALDKLQKNDHSKYGVLGRTFDAIKGFILPDEGFTKKIDTSNYVKGQIPWDGVAKKALTEVIPTQLAHIEAALTGGDIMIYDYDRGKFVTKKSVIKDAANTMQNYANRAGGDFRDDLRRAVNKSGANSARRDDMMKQIDAYFLAAFENGTGFDELFQDNFDKKKYGDLDDETLKLMQNMIKSYAKNGKGARAFVRSRVREQRESYSRRNRNMAGNEDPELQLHNGSNDFGNKATTGGLLGKDEYNHDIFWYLQGIWRYTAHLSDNIGLFGKGYYANRKRNRPPQVPTGGNTVVGLRDLRNTTKFTEKELKAQEEKIKAQEEAKKDENYHFGQEFIDAIVNGETPKKKKKGEKTKDEATKENQDKEPEQQTFSQTIDKLNEAFGVKDARKDLNHKKRFSTAIKGVLDAPAKIVDEISKAAQVSMTRLLYGKESTDEPGIFEYFYDKADNIFDKINTFFDDKFKINIKEYLKGLREKFFGDWDGTEYKGGFASGVATQFRGAMNSAKEWAFGDIDSFIRGKKDRKKKPETQEQKPDENENKDQEEAKGETKDVNNGQAAYGRKVTKTGLVAVSEGEMIVPSEYNPFYHGSTNKRKQIRDEQRAVNRYYGNYAKGGTVGNDEGLVGFLKEGGKTLGSGAVEFFKRLFGLDEETKKKDGKIIDDKVKTFVQESFGNLGNMAAGGLIGAGVSLFTGSIVGPFLGAAIGAGTALALNSEKVRHLLFGEFDDKGDLLKKGLLPEKLSKFMTSNIPSMGRGALLGGTVGLFGGSPFLGAIIGSGIGYINSSETAKNVLFGAFDNASQERTGGLISREIQNNIKKRMPNIAAGTIAGALAGPFGLAGNLIFGSAVGYFTGSEEFKNYVLGEEGQDKKRHGGLVERLRERLFGKEGEDGKRHGGLKGWFEEGFFKPARGIMQKLANEFRIHTRNMMGSFGKFVRKTWANIWESNIGAWIRRSAIGKFVSGAGKKIVGLGKAVLGVPSKMLKGADEALGARALKRGYGVYNNEKKRMMTSAERDQYREELRKKGKKIAPSEMENVDKVLAGMNGDTEGLKSMQSSLEGILDPTRKIDGEIKKTGSALNTAIESYSARKNNGVGLSDEDVNMLQKNIKKGDFSSDQLREFAQSRGLDQNQIDSLLSRHGALNEARNQRSKILSDTDEKKKQLSQQLGGVDLSDGNIRKIIDSVSNDLKADEIDKKRAKEEYDNKSPEEKMVQNQEESKEKVTKIADDVAAIRTAMAPKGGEGGINEQVDKLGDKITQAVTGDADPNTDQIQLPGGEIAEMKNTGDSKVPADTESKQAIEHAKESAELQDAAMENLAGKSKKGFGLGSILSLFGLGGDNNDLASTIAQNPTFKLFGNQLVKGLVDGLALWAIGSGALDKTAANVSKAMEGNQPKTAEGGTMHDTYEVDEDGNVERTDESLSKRAWRQVGRKTLIGGLEGAITGGGLKAIAKGALGKVTGGSLLGKLGKRAAGRFTNAGKIALAAKDKLAKKAKTAIDVAKYAKDKLVKKGKSAIDVAKNAKDKIAGKAEKVVGGIKNWFKPKNVANAAAEVGDAAGDAAEEAAKSNSIRSMIMNGFSKVLNAISSRIPESWKNKLAKFIEDATEQLAKASEKLDKALTSSALKTAAWVVKAATVIWDFEEGWNNAESFWGITEEATTTQKALSGLGTALWRLVPVISIIPEETVMSILIPIAEKRGLVDDDLTRQRDEATKEVDEYNIANSTNYNIKEYNKHVKGRWTWGERISNAASTLVHNVFGKKDEYAKSAGTTSTKATASSYATGNNGLDTSMVSSNSAAVAANGLDTSMVGKGSGMFVSQLDSQYKDIPFSNSNIGAIGCGPAVATMMINQEKPGSISMSQAIDAAKKYETINGTSSDYFGDIMKQYGLGASYSKDQKQIVDDLKAGRPTVLLGQDKNNRDKSKSPFGPNKHYVLAKYIDKNGNVIVDDPESSSPDTPYNQEILKNTALGISGPGNLDGDPTTGGSDVGGAITYDTAIAKNVYKVLREQGFSPAATSGIMGNLFAESGMDPTRVQTPSQNAAGIAQWENYKQQTGRWANMRNFAAKNGKDWTDLDSQMKFLISEMNTNDFAQRLSGEIAPGNLSNAGAPLGTTMEQFKQTEDVDLATRLFEGAFERAGKPRMDARLSASREYLKLLGGIDPSSIESVGSVDSTGDGADGSTNGTSEDGTQEKVGFTDVLSTIASAFTNAFSGLTKTKAEADAEAAANEAADGATAGADGYAVASDATGGPGSSKQQDLVKKMQSVEGKLTYSMSGARNPDQGSADCSSTVNWAYQKVFGKSIGTDTNSILNSDATEVVDMASSGMDQTSGGRNSSGPNLDKLMPGDLMLYSRPDSGYTAGRPFRVGHVEMYEGDGKRIGHGGGMGPKQSDATKDASHYIMAKRLKNVDSYGAGSGLLNKLRNLSGGASAMGGSAGDNSLMSKLVNASSVDEASNNTTSGATPATAGSTNVTAALQTLITYVKTLVTNTSSIPTISTTLTNYCNSNASSTVEDAATATDATAAATASTQASTQSQDDPGLQGLIDTMNAIAVG